MLSDELVKLIQAVVDAKINSSVLKLRSIQSAGDLGISSLGDVRIQVGVGKKAYYKGVELGSANTSNHATLTNLSYATSGHTGFAATGDLANYLQRSGGVGNQMLQSISMNSNEIYGMNHTQDWDTQSPDEGVAKGNITGANGFMSKAQTPANTWYFNSGLRLGNSGTPIDTDKGGLYYNTITESVYVNKGTLSASNWQKLLMSGETIVMGGQKITGLGAGTPGSSDAARMSDIVGVTAHSSLTQLNYASSGHTGFASAADLSLYLPTVGGIITNTLLVYGSLTSNNSVSVVSATPFIYLNNGSPVGYLSWVSGTGLSLNSQNGNLILGSPSATNILLKIANTTILNIFNTFLQSSVDIVIGANDAHSIGMTPAETGVHGKMLSVYASSAGGGSNLNGGQLTLIAGGSRGTGTSSIVFETASAGTSGSGFNTPTTKLTIGAMELTSTVNLNMGNQKIINVGGYSGGMTKSLNIVGGGDVGFFGNGWVDFWNWRRVGATTFNNNLLQLQTANYAGNGAIDRITIDKSATSANNDAELKLTACNLIYVKDDPLFKIRNSASSPLSSKISFRNASDTELSGISQSVEGSGLIVSAGSQDIYLRCGSGKSIIFQAG